MNKKNILTIMFRIISITIILICIIYISKWFLDNNRNAKLQKTLIEKVSFKDKDGKELVNINFNELLKINPDTVGWIQVNNTNINYSVVKTDNNSFYLNHSFDKSYNSAGWIFADYQNRFDGTDNNIILYGHNRTDGTMFNTLKNTLKEEWYTNKENHIIKFYTPNKVLLYKIFSIYEIPINELDNKTNFKIDSEFNSYLNNLKENSIYNFNIDVTSNDSIITLTTCSRGDFYRIMLHAKLTEN